MPDVSGLVKKTDYNAKISRTEKKYFTTSNYNKFTKEILNVQIKEKSLVDKSDISNLVQNSNLNAKLAALLTKAESKPEQDTIVKLRVSDSSSFLSKSHFEDDYMKNYLVFKPVLRYFKKS